MVLTHCRTLPRASKLPMANLGRERVTAMSSPVPILLELGRSASCHLMEGRNRLSTER